MATYTEHYGLHQWEPTDDFLRTDFNTDFGKIDAALDGLERSKPGLEDLEEVRALAESRCRIILGSYEGDGRDDRLINVGAKPAAVIVWSGMSSYLAFEGYDESDITMQPTGFQVSNRTAGAALNEKGYLYSYLAMVQA